MKRLTLQWISLTAAAAVLAAGCAAGPQRAPDRNNPNAGNNVSTTTGDADACAVALGNSVAPGGTMNPGGGVGAAGGTAGAANGTAGGTAGGANGGAARGQEVTANGVIIGNVALVALPTADNLPTTPPTTDIPATPVTPVTPGANGAAPGANGAAPGANGAAPVTPPGAAAPGTTGAAPGTTGAGVTGTYGARAGDLVPGGATVGAPGTRTTADTIIPGTKATPAPITGAAAPPNPIITAETTPGDANAQGAPGGVQDNRYNAPAAGGAANAVGTDADAIDRIKVACDKLADIRVVNDAGDRARLASITDAIRSGRPITDFMADITRMSQAATSVGGGRNANVGPGGPAGAAPAPVTGAPADTAPAPVTGAPAGAPAGTAPAPATTPVTPGLP